MLATRRGPRVPVLGCQPRFRVDPRGEGFGCVVSCTVMPDVVGLVATAGQPADVAEAPVPVSASHVINPESCDPRAIHVRSSRQFASYFVHRTVRQDSVFVQVRGSFGYQSPPVDNFVGFVSNPLPATGKTASDLRKRRSEAVCIDRRAIQHGVLAILLATRVPESVMRGQWICPDGSAQRRRPVVHLVAVRACGTTTVHALIVDALADFWRRDGCDRERDDRTADRTTRRTVTPSAPLLPRACRLSAR